MKGFVYMLEVALALGIILGAVFLILGTAPERTTFNMNTLSQQAYSALDYLNNNGELKKLVYENDETSIINKVNAMLPSGIKIDVDVCTTTCSSSLAPEEKSIVAFDYFVTGYRNYYSAKRIRVWVWEAF